MNDQVVFNLVSNENSLVLSNPGMSYRWEPEPDITTYELALCIPFLVGGWAKDIETLPHEARRHFTRTF